MVGNTGLMKAYCFPGLGFDKRVFNPLKSEIGDLHAFNWLPPEKNEAFSAYATRLVAGHKLDENTVLIGHSLGGMLAQELAAKFPVRKVILLSSIIDAKENPWYFKMLSPFGLYHLFSRNATTATVKLWGPAHDYVTAEEQRLFAQMVHTLPRRYYLWALRTLSIWKEPELSSNLAIVRFHGSNDLTFPIKQMGFIDYKIEGGGHFMLYKKAQELLPLLQSEIRS